MSEGVPRVPPPYERGGVKKDPANVDKEEFKKLMRVEEVSESEAGEKRKRKRREEEAEEEAVKKAGGGATQKKAKAIESVEGTPLARKKVAPQAIPSTPTAPPTGKAASVASFKAEEIEAFAWEEEAEAPPKPLTAAAAGPEITRPPREKVAGPEITGEAPKKLMGAKAPPPTAAPPPTEAPAALPPTPQEPFAPPEQVIEKTLAEEAPPSPPLEKYTEEWPQTTAYRPAPAFRSLESPPETEYETDRLGSRVTPSEEKKWEQDKRKEATQERRRENEKPHEPERAEKKRGATKKAPAETPGLPGKKAKEAPTKAFAEYMEEGEETKPAAKTAPTKAAAKKEVETAVAPEAKHKAEMPKAPPTPGMPQAPVAAGEAPPTALPKELAPTAASAALQGNLPTEETFPSLKKTAGTTISSEKTDKEKREREEGLPAGIRASHEAEAGLGGEAGGQERRREEEKEHIVPIAGAVPEMAAPLPHIEAPPPVAASPYAQMSPQVLALFERMVGVMTIIQTTGVTETVMTLNARQFASSVLYGSQIVIREYSSAPTRFNVEFIGSPQALSLVQQNVPALMGAVQQGNFNFSINRFDVKLATTEKPIFTRKEALEEKGEGDERENERETP